MSKKQLFRSGNYAICLDRAANQLEIVQLAASSGCIHPEHYVGKKYPNTLDILEDAVFDCVCLAAKSLKAGSGEKIAKIQ